MLISIIYTCVHVYIHIYIYVFVYLDVFWLAFKTLFGGVSIVVLVLRSKVQLLGEVLKSTSSFLDSAK